MFPHRFPRQRQRRHRRRRAVDRDTGVGADLKLAMGDVDANVDGAAVRRRPQADNLGTQGYRAVVAVPGDVMKGDVNGHLGRMVRCTPTMQTPCQNCRHPAGESGRSSEASTGICLIFPHFSGVGPTAAITGQRR